MSKLIKDFKLFENSDSDEYILQTLKDILLEIQDEDVKCKITSNNLCDQWVMVVIDVNSKLTDREKRSGFLDLPDWFMESLSRASDFMESNGFKSEYYVKIPSGWSDVDDLEELAECNWLVFEIGINFILRAIDKKK